MLTKKEIKEIERKLSTIFNYDSNLDHHWEIDGNFWCKDTYTYVRALQEAKTLVNCVGCVDCTECTNCSYCVECDSCTDCHNSWSCIDCTNCTYIEESDHNINIHNSSLCNNCISTSNAQEVGYDYLDGYTGDLNLNIGLQEAGSDTWD